MSVQATERGLPRFIEEYPEIGTAPVSTEAYTSPEYFEWERERVFKRSWLNIGRVEQIPNAGDYFVKDLPILQTSVLVVRGRDGKVRAFHNACKHRGNQLARLPEGCGAKGFACGFHGWVYDLDGSLKAVPVEESYYGLDKKALGLSPLSVDVWEGFIFINYQENPDESLEEYLGELGERYRGYPFGQMEMLAGYSALVHSNWKITADAFQEAHHVPFVHKDTVADGFTSKDNPYCAIQWAKLYERHRTASVYGNPDTSRPLRPAEGLAIKWGVTFAQGDASKSKPLPGVNPAGVDPWAFDINVIFPHFFVDPSTGFFFTMHFWPLEVNKTLWEFRFYMFPAQNLAQRISMAYTNAIMRDGGREDLSTVEVTQKMLESGTIKEIVFSDQELLCRHSQKTVDDMVRARR